MNAEHELDRLLNSQETRQFARILGKQPITTELAFTIHTHPDELFSVVGPPEVTISTDELRVMYWNFVRADQKTGFTLFAKPGEKQFYGAAQSDWTTLYSWVLGRLGAVSQGEEPPMFLGKSSFAIHRIVE